ncbi:MAG: Stp1/IreP family PP2C-type Ser/Thr phosphatase [Cyanobacteria bacterium P01_D01_bin.105]
MSYLPIRLSFAGLTDVGLLRSANQDCYYLDPDGSLFVVADGMGGHVGGQEASRLATNAIRTYIEANTDLDHSPHSLLEQAIFTANEAVLADQGAHPERAHMGTTVVILLVRDGQFWCAHVGDSRLYLMRESKFVQITQDHTWVTQAIKDGTLSPEQSHSHPWRHVLSQCVGREDLNSIETQPVEIKPGDQLLLCSDGLTEEVSDDAIMACLQEIGSCEGQVSALIEAAKAQGGRDNITAIAIAVSV